MLVGIRSEDDIFPTPKKPHFSKYLLKRIKKQCFINKLGRKVSFFVSKGGFFGI
tara:strand:+ start:2250 stop:2411 length:162 start_codon:yes stop_codon:yes gene_type:complete